MKYYINDIRLSKNYMGINFQIRLQVDKIAVQLKDAILKNSDCGN